MPSVPWLWSWGRLTTMSGFALTARIPKVSPDGKFPAWWETYLNDEGFDTCYRYFDGLIRFSELRRECHRLVRNGRSFPQKEPHRRGRWNGVVDPQIAPLRTSN